MKIFTFLGMAMNERLFNERGIDLTHRNILLLFCKLNFKEIETGSRGNELVYYSLFWF